MMQEDCKSFSLHDCPNWEINELYGVCGRDEMWNESNVSFDPVDFLPVDPFEMNLETTLLGMDLLLEMDLGTKISAAIAGWIEASNDSYEVNGETFIADLSYYWSKAVLSSFETQLNPRSYVVDFSNKGFSGSATDVFEDESFGTIVSIEKVSVTGNINIVHPCGDESSLHEGLILSLGYLGVQDLLSVERVCRSFRVAVQSDPLLWRCIHIDSPLSERITDDDLYKLIQRSQGSLHCLSLMRCSRLTDEGLKSVLGSCLRLKKLSIPGCLRLSIKGLINSLKAAKLSGAAGLNTLQLGRLFIASPEQFEELTSLVGAKGSRLSKAPKLKFYHDDASSLSCDDDRAIDIEECPVCQRCRLVFDCSLASCRNMHPGNCRACSACIPRCVQCGRCINNFEYVETFCLEYVCLDCWKRASQSEHALEDI